jgi:RHS repeat-associated protein
MPTLFRMPSCRRKGATPSRIPIRKTGITTTTGTAWTAPTQNAVGNLTQTPQPLALGSGYDLKYDAWNRLVEVKVTGGSVVATHRYDGANRRVTKLTGANTQHYYYSDQWQILEERLNAGTSADRRFVWGQRYPDDLVLRDQGGARLYALHDYFHPTAVIDTTGAVQERYGYDGFGTPRYMTAAFGSRASSVHGWETLYGAYRYDLESGLYQVRNRYLHAKLGRWLSRDPIDYNGGINLYGYVGNKALNKIDLFGLSDENRPPIAVFPPGSGQLPIYGPPAPAPSPRPGGGGQGDGSVFDANFGGGFGGGVTTLYCCDEDNNKIKATFVKYCIGLYFGASATIGRQTGVRGKNCPKGFNGWFVEAGGGFGVYSGGGAVSPDGSVGGPGLGIGLGGGIWMCNYALLNSEVVGKCCK